MVYDTKRNEIHFDRFLNLDKYLPEKSFLVLNQTRVSPVRIFGKKSSGGKVELLILLNEMDPKDKIIKALANKKLRVGEVLNLDSTHRLETLKTDQKAYEFSANFPLEKLPALLKKLGQTPIPKYIKKSPLKETELRKRYQSIFAKKGLPSSVAAPTASLHFTDRVFRKLEKKGIPHFFVNLDVGLGTFAPVTAEQIQEKRLHKEPYSIAKTSAEKIRELRKTGHACVAVGSTVVRTLESFASTKKLAESTELFIQPPYAFQSVDCLISNFHVPNSSLMMMVQAFLEHKKAERNIKELYEIAIKADFRFYSFGDAMLIL